MSGVKLEAKLTASTAREVCRQLRELDASQTDAPIVLQIHSGGGSVASAIAILNQMERSRRPVFTHCSSRCASMAAILLMAGKRRSAAPDAQILVHKSQAAPLVAARDHGAQTSSARAFRSAQRLKKREMVEACNWVLVDQMAKYSGTPLFEMRRAFERIDGTWLNVDSAREHGFID